MNLFKRNKNINNDSNNNETNNNEVKQEKPSYIKKYSLAIKSLVNDEINKPKEERSRDLKALIATIIIIPILIFIFWKIPFIRNFLFP